ncbi:MAG: heavy-metal-associated domain-containing protein [Acidiferrobacterales bacterium]
MSIVETHFKVTGMKCDGCIAQAREALSKIPGFVDARFGLNAGTAVVQGDVEPQAVVQALTEVGYPAELRSN